MITANGARLSLLVAIATLGVGLGTPAVMALGGRNGMPEWQRQSVLVALVELTVVAGTLTYFSTTRPTYERVIGAVLVVSAMGVTVYAGVTTYGWLGFIAPVAYMVAAHLTAAPRRELAQRSDPSPPGPLKGPTPTVPTTVAMPAPARHAAVEPATIEPDMAAIEASTETGSPTDPFPVPEIEQPSRRKSGPPPGQGATAANPKTDDELAQQLREYRLAQPKAPSRQDERDHLGVGWNRFERVVKLAAKHKRRARSAS